jgi:hypothetical protein
LLDQLYLTKLMDMTEAGPLQLVRYVSRYAESTFSQFCQEYLLDTAHKIWWESNHPDDAELPPSLNAILPRFFDRLKSIAMAHAWELFLTLAINPNRTGAPRIMKKNCGPDWLSVKRSQKRDYRVTAATATPSQGAPRGGNRRRKGHSKQTHK